MVELALREGRLFLHEGQHRLAIPAALAALAMLTELHGSAHIQLTPAYLVLAEAAIGTPTHTHAHTHTHTHTHRCAHTHLDLEP